MSGAQVSVLIPAYHAESFIAQAVKSVQAQTFTSWEAIVISDDGRDYLQILRQQGIEDTRLRQVSTGKTGSGPSHARNIGLRAARAGIIAALDSDDLFTPKRLEVMLPLALAHGFVTSSLELREETGRAFASNAGLIGSRLIGPAEYPLVNFSANAMVMFDRARVPHEWPEALPVFEDLAFSLMAYNHLEHVYHVDEALYIYIKRSGSLCNSAETAKNFVQTKEELRRLLESDPNAAGFTNKTAVAALLKLLRLSLAAEHAYGEAWKRNPKISFLEVLQPLAEREGVHLPFRMF